MPHAEARHAAVYVLPLGVVLEGLETTLRELGYTVVEIDSDPKKDWGFDLIPGFSNQGLRCIVEFLGEPLSGEGIWCDGHVFVHRAESGVVALGVVADLWEHGLADDVSATGAQARTIGRVLEGLERNLKGRAPMAAPVSVQAPALPRPSRPRIPPPPVLPPPDAWPPLRAPASAPAPSRTDWRWPAVAAVALVVVAIWLVLDAIEEPPASTATPRPTSPPVRQTRDAVEECAQFPERCEPDWLLTDEALYANPLLTIEWPEPADEVVYVNAPSLGLHDGPGAGFSTIAYPLCGDALEMLDMRGHWLEVRFGDRQGWVDSNFVTSGAVGCGS